MNISFAGSLIVVVGVFKYVFLKNIFYKTDQFSPPQVMLYFESKPCNKVSVVEEYYRHFLLLCVWLAGWLCVYTLALTSPSMNGIAHNLDTVSSKVVSRCTYKNFCVNYYKSRVISKTKIELMFS